GRRRRSSSPLFPYTTLFRSAERIAVARRNQAMGGEDLVERTGEVLPRHAGGIAGEAPAGIKRTPEGEDGTPPQKREKAGLAAGADRKSTRLNSSHVSISYAV